MSEKSRQSTALRATRDLTQNAKTRDLTRDAKVGDGYFAVVVVATVVVLAFDDGAVGPVVRHRFTTPT